MRRSFRRLLSSLGRIRGGWAWKGGRKGCRGRLEWLGSLIPLLLPSFFSPLPSPSHPHIFLESLAIITLLKWVYPKRWEKKMMMVLCVGGGKRWNFTQPVLSRRGVFSKGCGKFSQSVASSPVRFAWSGLCFFVGVSKAQFKGTFYTLPHIRMPSFHLFYALVIIFMQSGKTSFKSFAFKACMDNVGETRKINPRSMQTFVRLCKQC